MAAEEEKEWPQRKVSQVNEDRIQNVIFLSPSALYCFSFSAFQCFFSFTLRSAALTRHTDSSFIIFTFFTFLSLSLSPYFCNLLRASKYQTGGEKPDFLKTEFIPGVRVS